MKGQFWGGGGKREGQKGNCGEEVALRLNGGRNGNFNGVK